MSIISVGIDNFIWSVTYILHGMFKYEVLLTLKIFISVPYQGLIGRRKGQISYFLLSRS